MSIPEFPPNSDASKNPRQSTKIVNQVVTGNAARRRRSMRRKFTDVFVGGDFRSTIEYVMFDVLLPGAQDTLLDMIQSGSEKLIKGSARKRSTSSPYGGATGTVQYTNYTRYAAGRSSGPERVAARRSRSAHEFDEIILDSRVEAQEVLEQLHELVSKYGTASVADLYTLVGLPTEHTDNKWGWDDLQGAGVSRQRGGFLLDLPEPEPLD